MSTEHLVRMTDEQREQIKLKREADQEYALLHLKTEYIDEPFWRTKASEYNIRLPGWWIHSSELKYVRKACKKLGVDIKEFVESTGFSNLNQLAEVNNTWSVLGLVGLVIEYKTYEKFVVI